MSCRSSSYENYKDQGQRITQELILELKKIQTRDQLIASSVNLKRIFSSLAMVMIEAEHYCKKHPNQEVLELVFEERYYSEKLREELNRIYEIEGGREGVEKCQEQALFLLGTRM